MPSEGGGETIASKVHVRGGGLIAMRLRKVNWSAIAISASCRMLCCIDRSKGLWQRIQGVRDGYTIKVELRLMEGLSRRTHPRRCSRPSCSGVGAERGTDDQIWWLEEYCGNCVRC